MSTPPPPEPVKVWSILVLAFSVLMILGFMVWVLEGELLALHLPALLINSALTGVLLLPVVSGRGRRRLAEWPSAGRRALVIVAILLVATMNFAVLTGVLYQQGVLRLDGPNLSEGSIGPQAFGFYLWHLLDAVPVLDITETLRWETPYEYRDFWSGLLLVAFKVVVITPIILALTVRTPPKEAAKERFDATPPDRAGTASEAAP